MLFLTRKAGQAVMINDNIEINVIEITGKTVKLGFNFPATERVLRQELYERIKSETEVAASTMGNINDSITLKFAEQTAVLEKAVTDTLKDHHHKEH